MLLFLVFPGIDLHISHITDMFDCGQCAAFTCDGINGFVSIDIQAISHMIGQDGCHANVCFDILIFCCTGDVNC
jgi:hypothetical protein